jgi:hypothetical protein
VAIFDVIKNRLIHLGKISNFSILSVPMTADTKKRANNHPVMTYSDYKFWRSPTNSTF